ncbi:MAG: DEAD/DEAH box helicase [Paludibacteraceae bacterium]|nr:DEAD/DEAH box helicase [Paludibacteraceae bacterium]
MTFDELGLNRQIIDGIRELGFVAPMPVQEKVIPYLIGDKNRDLVALAETGSGKTAAFGLPILNTIDTSQYFIQALVMSPTRELCMQIAKDIQSYGKYMRGVKVVAVYGGENIVTQYKQLDVQPQILVATPGRLVDLIKRGKVHLDDVQTLVLDEADEMLDMGFKEDLEFVLQQMPEDHRSLMFSATMPREISEIAKTYMHDHEEITIGTRNAGAENVEHIFYMVKSEHRYLALKRIVDINPNIYAIVFCRTRQETKDVADNLIRDGYNADALHGDLTQAQRDTVMERFRHRSLQVLVATDVAARGLDVSDLTHVINYNLPDDIEVYTHRSGRTGRAGKKGISIAIIHQREQYRIHRIEKIIKKDFVRAMVPVGADICKKQLFYQIHKMENASVDYEQIECFMPEVMAKLSYLTKEEVIERFVSLEFNRFAEYYKSAEDINIKTKEKPEKRKEKAEQNKTVRKEGSAKKEKHEKNEKFQRQDKTEKQGRKKGKSKLIRLKLSFGAKQNATIRSVLGLINNYVGDKNVYIGDIEITQKYTFFDVYADQAERVFNAFSGRKGRGLKIELA